MIRLGTKLKTKTLHLKSVVTLLFLFGIMFFIKLSNKTLSIAELSTTEDDVFARRLPQFIIIGAKKCGTCEQKQSKILILTDWIVRCFSYQIISFGNETPDNFLQMFTDVNEKYILFLFSCTSLLFTRAS